MQYLGGKQRLGKTIAGFVNEFAAVFGAETYAEPFCGMVGVGRHVTVANRLFRDIHPDLIMFLQSIQMGWTPPENVTEDEYKRLRHAPPSALRGFVGFGCSFGGKWFGGFARDSTGTNYAVSQARSASVKMADDLVGSSIECGVYQDTPEAGITYCDPPYVGTTGYSGTGKFDHSAFWEWVRNRRGVVIVSEYEGPKWMDVLWEKHVKCMLKRDAKSGEADTARTEKLFIKV